MAFRLSEQRSKGACINVVDQPIASLSVGSLFNIKRNYARNAEPQSSYLQLIW